MNRYIRILCCVLVLCIMCGCSAALPDDSSETSPRFFKALGEIVDGIVNTEKTVVTEIEQTEIEIDTNKEVSNDTAVYEESNNTVNGQETVRRSEVMCYSKLNDVQKRIYRIFLTASEKMVDGWISLGKCGTDYENNISMAYRAFTGDHPEIFWMPASYLLSHRGSGANADIIIAFSLDDGENSCEYTVPKSRRNAMRDELNAAVEEAKSRTDNLIYGFDIELALHDFICEKAVYDDASDDPLIYTAYGALVSGKAVCEGYSRAMQLLCDMAGIPCVIIYGEAEGMGHMWNLVNPGDAWYHLDITWDDTEQLSHTYFNLSDNEIQRDHIIYQSYYDSSVKNISEYNLISFDCNETYSNYFHINGYILNEDYSVAAACISAVSTDGASYIQIRIDSEKTLSEFNADYEACATKVQKYLNRISGNKVVINGISIHDNIVTFYW